MKAARTLLLSLLFAPTALIPADATAPKQNILLICVDDLKLLTPACSKMSSASEGEGQRRECAAF